MKEGKGEREQRKCPAKRPETTRDHRRTNQDESGAHQSEEKLVTNKHAAVSKAACGPCNLLCRKQAYHCSVCGSVPSPNSEGSI